MLQIRKSELSDSVAMSGLLRQLGYATSAEQVAEFLQRADESRSEVFVAELDRVVVGLMSLIYFDYFPVVERVCRITALVVDANAREMGVGSRLLDLAKSKAIECQCSAVEVTTALAREKAHQFYEGAGFARTSLRFVRNLGATV